LAAQGNHQQAIQEAQTLVNNAEQQMQNVLNDVDGAIKYVIDGENRHHERKIKFACFWAALCAIHIR